MLVALQDGPLLERVSVSSEVRRDRMGLGRLIRIQYSTDRQKKSHKAFIYVKNIIMHNLYRNI